MRVTRSAVVGCTRRSSTRASCDTSTRNTCRKKFARDENAGALDESRVQYEIGGLLGEGDYERIDYRYEDQRKASACW